MTTKPLYLNRNIVFNFRRKRIYDSSLNKNYPKEFFYCRPATLPEREKFLNLLKAGELEISFSTFGLKYQKEHLWNFKREVSINLVLSSSTIESLNLIADRLGFASYSEVIKHLINLNLRTVNSTAVEVDRGEAMRAKYETQIKLLKTQLDNILENLVFKR